MIKPLSPKPTWYAKAISFVLLRLYIDIKIPKKIEIGIATSKIAGKLNARTNIKSSGYNSPREAFSKNWMDSFRKSIPNKIKKVTNIVLDTCFKIYRTIIFGIISFYNEY